MCSCSMWKERKNKIRSMSGTHRNEATRKIKSYAGYTGNNFQTTGDCSSTEVLKL